jgi:hypothetical protein
LYTVPLSSLPRKTLALLGAFTFAFFLGTVIHEYGHVIALRYYNVDQYSVIIHPFKGNQVNWVVNNDYIGIVDAAGPLFNVVFGNLLLIILWNQRYKVLPSFLLLAPVSLIQEGFNTFIQVILALPGTDSMRIISAGVPGVVLLVIGCLGFICGVFLLVLLLPLFGVSPMDSVFERVFSLVFGLGGYMVLILVYSVLFYPSGVIRGIVLVLFTVVVGVVIALLYGWVDVWAWLGLSVLSVDIGWGRTWSILGLAICVLIFGLLI